MLTAGELAAMQAVQNRALPGTVVIERYGLTADGMGGYTEAWTAAGTVTGRIYPAAGSERVTGGQPVSVAQWQGTFPVGTSLSAKDRVRYAGRTFEVTAVNNGEMWQTAVRADLLAMNEEARV